MQDQVGDCEAPGIALAWRNDYPSFGSVCALTSIDAAVFSQPRTAPSWGEVFDGWMRAVGGFFHLISLKANEWAG